MTKILDYQQIDGIFGAKTEQAVKDFQLSQGLTVDGIVGTMTWAALPPDPGTVLLQKGMSESTVVALQNGLKRIQGIDPGAADGIFGPKTDAAVKSYQSQRGVVVDGMVGDRTWWVPAGAAGATLASLCGLTTV
ncbi:MAG: peptidoglycan-binding protein [Synechococcales cyanobacterium T60_A2020_003]|nr:peptidoglycan-binding protein [Synechococcales cyanobacterium T60_A2020_003]